jgi:polysaccharide export outer membrane protein
MKKLIFACLMMFAGMLHAADNPLGTGDMLRITVYGNPDMTTETRVTADGTISLPLVGEVKIGGISVPEAEHRIAKLLENGRFIKQPQVNIVILQFISQQVSVLGEVLKPGRYPLDHPSTLTDLLAIAGGVVTATGSDQITVISHKDGKSSRQEYDIRELFRKNGSPDVGVSSGDIIYVPRAPVFYIYGEVQRPGVFRLERDMIVAQALATGGGLTARGTERSLRIKRRNAKGELETISAEASTPLLADDVLLVQESLF